MKRVLVGDLHGVFGNIPYLRKLHADADEIIIVGDMGVGFPGPQDDMLRKMAAEITEKPFVRFIRGNHDNPETCRTFTEGGITWIPDGHVEDGILFIGGAWSIDYGFRTPGVNWWFDEELNEEEWDTIFRDLEDKFDGIHTVITHDAPARVVHMVLGAGKTIFKTRTSMNLDMLLNRLPRVKLWVFGHYHEYTDFRKGNTRFVCLPDKLGRTLTIGKD